MPSAKMRARVSIDEPGSRARRVFRNALIDGGESPLWSIASPPHVIRQSWSETDFTGFVLKILKFISHSPTRAIEHFQDNKNRAIHLLSGFH
jgi:hypothetical protein